MLVLSICRLYCELTQISCISILFPSQMLNTLLVFDRAAAVTRSSMLIGRSCAATPSPNGESL